MCRLIVVSNRVREPDPSAGSAGGLAMAIAAALREYSGLWFGWSGETTENFTGHLQFKRVHGVTIATIDLEEQDVQEYYNGYANKTLWPLFHYRVDLTEYHRSFSQGYVRANERFASTLAPLIEPSDMVWVQDYHLIPLGGALRRHGVNNPLGFFLHIPWPARQLFTTLPRHRQLAEALFAYDLIGFQTEDFVEAFRDYVIHELGGQALPDGGLRAFGRTIRAAAFPIGVDAEDFAAVSRTEAALESERRMRESLNGRRMIVGVDRLDYSKGLPERMKAYEHFLSSRREFLEQVFLLQIAPTSRDVVEAYQDIRVELETLSGRINGAYGTVDWVPVRYVNSQQRRDELAGIYRAAAVGLVTPLRDGMNLVAKEYVAAQDPGDPGVLVLSRFAGAAAQMTDALIVNPYSPEEVADALARALAMDKAERVRRWETLMHGVTTKNVDAWRDDFVHELQAIVAPPALAANGA